MAGTCSPRPARPCRRARDRGAGLRGYADAVAGECGGPLVDHGHVRGGLPTRVRPRRRRPRRRSRRGRAGHGWGDDQPRHRHAPRLGGVCGRRTRHAGYRPVRGLERVRPEQPARPGCRLGLAHGCAGRRAGGEGEDRDDPAGRGGRRDAHRDRPDAGLRRRHHRDAGRVASRGLARRHDVHARRGRAPSGWRTPSAATRSRRCRSGAAFGVRHVRLVALSSRDWSGPPEFTGARSLAVTDLGVYGTRADASAPDTSIVGGPADDPCSPRGATPPSRWPPPTPARRSSARLDGAAWTACPGHGGVHRTDRGTPRVPRRVPRTAPATSTRAPPAAPGRST